MKLKVKVATTIIGLTLLTSFGWTLVASQCNSGQRTIGPTTQTAACAVLFGNGCTEITVSPAYQAPMVEDQCTKLVYTGSGSTVVTITTTTKVYTCKNDPTVGLYCATPVTTTTSTTTKNQPLNFSSCTCPG